MQDDERRERGYDAITFAVAGVLVAILLGAIGYGIFTSSRMATTIPNDGVKNPPPAATTGAR
jgi:hypothetical protein